MFKKHCQVPLCSFFSIKDLIFACFYTTNTHNSLIVQHLCYKTTFVYLLIYKFNSLILHL